MPPLGLLILLLTQQAGGAGAGREGGGPMRLLPLSPMPLLDDGGGMAARGPEAQRPSAGLAWPAAGVVGRTHRWPDHWGRHHHRGALDHWIRKGRARGIRSDRFYNYNGSDMST